MSKTKSSDNLGRHCLMKSAEVEKYSSASSLKRNTSEQLTEKENNELVKKKLLEQPLQDFEETLRTAANLKTILKKESSEATTEFIMSILDKDENKKPVSYSEEMEYIDVDGEVVAESKAPQLTNVQIPICGNIVTELNPMTLHSSRYSSHVHRDSESRGAQSNIKCDESEQSRFMPPFSMLKPHETILGPGTGGMFTSFNQTPVGCDLIQRNPLSAHQFQEINRFLSNENGDHNSFNTMPEKKEEPKQVVESKQRKTKKKQTKAVEYTAQENSFSDKTLNEILAVLGEKVSLENPKGKKKRNQQQRVDSKEKEKNNKKKEKQNSKMEKEKVATSSGAATTVLEEESGVVPASVNNKRCSSGVGGQSEEGDDDNYMSAEENLGGSNSRLSTPPAEFVDARASREEGLHDVMLDPSNYRDDEDVEQLAKQLMKEDEFITVGKNKKKNRQQTEEKDTSASASPQLSAARRFSDGNGKAASVSSGNGNRRPTATAATLADYIDLTKKDTHKNVKHKFKVVSYKKDEEQEADRSEPTVPISVNTRTSTPAFSYADAAKKSSGENTPQNDLSPSPAPVAVVKALNEATTSSSVEMPPNGMDCASSGDDITFGYDETVGMEVDEQKGKPEEKDGEFVLKLGERVIRFAKGHADKKAKASTKPQTTAMLNTLRDGWFVFQSGTPPMVYNPDKE